MNVRPTPFENLAVGDIVTPIECRNPHFQSAIPPGTPLEILSISAPFLLCGILQPDGRVFGPITVDLRHFHVLVMDPEYVDTYRRFASHPRFAGHAASPSLPPPEDAAKAQQLRLPFRPPAPPDEDPGLSGSPPP